MSTIFSPQHIPSKRFVFISIVCMMTVALCLSMVFFIHQSLRLDESQSLWQTARSLPAVIDIVAHDVHMPLYHIILRAWEVPFGNGVEATRVLSLLFFLASIPALYALGTYAYGRSIGLFVALLATLSPFFNWYGNEIRMYSLLTFLAILNHLFYLKIYREGKRSAWLLYALTAVLGVYTHYFFGLLLVTQALFYLHARRDFPIRSFRKFVFVAVGVLAAVAPWMYYVIVRTGGFSLSSPFLIKPTSIDIFNAFSQFLFGFQDDAINTVIIALWPIIMLLTFLALQLRKGVSTVTQYFFMQMVGPILAVFLFSVFVTPLFLSRYLIISALSLYLILGWLFSIYPRVFGRAFAVILIVSMSAGIAMQALSAHTPVKEDYRAAIEHIMAYDTPSDIIIASAPFTIYPLEYYYRGPNAIVTLPRWDRFSTGPIPPFSLETLPRDVPQIIGAHSRAWLLLSYNQGYEDEIRLYFDNHYAVIDRKDLSRNLTLLLYKIRYDIPQEESVHDLSQK